VAVIEKALAKQREERYQSAAEMAEALREVQKRLNDQPAIGATMVETPAETAIPQPGATFVEGRPVVAPVGDASAGANLGAQPDATYVEQSSSAGTPIDAPPGSSPPGGSPQVAAAGPEKNAKKGPNLLLIGGIIGIVLLIVLVAGGALAFSLMGGGGDDTTLVAEGSTVTATEPVGMVDAANTAVPTNTIPPTETSPPTATLPPTETPTPTSSPTPTVPPGIPYVQITNISIEGSYYVVEYETYEYIEELPGMHVHFFYDTVPPEEAGVPGSGPWKLYGGPRPFRGYTTNSRPNGAVMMCALVANPNHSVQPESGTCFPLPDVTPTPDS
jgi:hypothetical protein